MLDTTWATALAKSFEAQRDEVDSAFVKATGSPAPMARSNGHSPARTLAKNLARGARRRDILRPRSGL